MRNVVQTALLCVGLMLASGGIAQAATRTASINDGIDAQDTSPSLTPRPVIREVVAAAATYDDSTGTVHATITFNLPITTAGVQGVSLQGATECGGNEDDGTTGDPPLLAISPQNTDDGSVAFVATLNGYDGSVPASVAVSADGLTASLDVTNGNFAHRDYKCADASYLTALGQLDSVRGYFQGYAPQKLTTGNAGRFLGAELVRRFPTAFHASDTRNWLKCPSQEANIEDEDSNPTDLCEFRFYDTDKSTWRDGYASIGQDANGYLTTAYFSTKAFSKTVQTCHIRRNLLTYEPQVLSRTLRADGFVTCSDNSASMVRDLDYKPKPGVTYVGFHGTNQDGFQDAVSFRCRVKRSGSRYSAQCANKLGDRFEYAFTLRAKAE